MATVNKRVKKIRSLSCNGLDAGGVMSANVVAGFETVTKSSPDGLEVALKDRECQFVRGTIVSQDWIHFADLLTGTVGTMVFYERKSGVAAATGYIKHTITNPVIHGVKLSISKGGYGTIAFDFECRAADESKTIADMWAQLDDQAAPSYISAARGGVRVESTLHGAQAIYHVTSFEFGLAMNLAMACNDSDVAYTCVDAESDNMICGGAISYQDATIASAKILTETLALATRASLVLNVRQGGGAASKVITIAGVQFDAGTSKLDVTGKFTEYTSPFEVTNNISTQLTLSGANKIITIEDAA